MPAEMKNAAPGSDPRSSGERDKALNLVLGQIERNFGKGSIMRLGDASQLVAVAQTSTSGLVVATAWVSICLALVVFDEPAMAVACVLLSALSFFCGLACAPSGPSANVQALAQSLWWQTQHSQPLPHVLQPAGQEDSRSRVHHAWQGQWQQAQHAMPFMCFLSMVIMCLNGLIQQDCVEKQK